MQKERKSDFYKQEKITAIAFITLPLLGFTVFTLFSLVAVTYFSFCNFNTFRNSIEWIGLRNFTDLFTNPTYSGAFINAIKNTLFLLLSIPLSMAAGFALAAMLQSKSVKRGNRFFQVLLYLPSVTSAVAVNLVFKYIFNPSYGMINSLLNVSIAWFSNEWLIKIAIIIKNTWGGLGYAMILFLAAMLAVPEDYYEAADVDGASSMRKLFTITLPLVTPTVFYLMVTGIIGGLQSYADSQIFGGGSSGAQTIVYFIWSYGINQGKQGLASAAAIILAVVIMVITILQFYWSSDWVYGEDAAQ